MMIEYNIFCAVNMWVLISVINDAKKNGWTPIGGVAVGTSGEMYQAVTRSPDPQKQGEISNSGK